MLDRLATNGLRLPRWPGYALAAAAVAFGASDARAACGDYVHVAPAEAAPATDASPAEALPSHLPKPCHGPSCHRVPDRAPLTPVAPAPPTVEKAACSATDPDLPAAGGELVLTHVPPPLPAGQPYRPERPPRA